jgi:diguanylate cyclase (GGDEF)-like protein/PAS domain S-box-containing protein
VEVAFLTLRKKTLIIITVSFFCLLGLLYAVGGLVFFGSVTALEENEMRNNMKRALAVLEDNLDTMSATALDWAAWDDTYLFMAGDNPDYPVNYLMGSTFETLNLNLIAFSDNRGDIFYARAYDLEYGQAAPLPPGLEHHLFPESPFVHKHTDSVTTGVILLHGVPMLIASRPVLTSEEQGPIRGTLIMGRFLDESVAGYFSRMLRLPVTFLPPGETVLPDKLREPLTPGTLFFTARQDRETLSGYALLEDIYGNPALYLLLRMPRDVFAMAQTGMTNIVVIILVLGVAFSTAIIAALEKTVLSRVAGLTRLVIDVSETGDTSKRLLRENGNDELSRLSAHINQMLERLELSHLVIAEREARLRLITDNMLDTISQVDMKGRLLYVSPSHRTLLGYAPESMVGKGFLDFVHPKDRARIRKSFRKGVETLLPQREEFRYLHVRGHTIWAEGIGRFFPDNDGNPAGGVVSCRDISERKKMEEQLRYLSLHDALTGLYNRTYFEQEMQRLKSGRAITSIGLIICDVDGLKFYNDTLGHDIGDNILKAAASVIRSCFRDGDMIARIGGDEFAVLLPDTTLEAVEGACRRLREALRTYNEHNPDLPLSISLGFTVSDDPSTADELFREADDNMYREKLHSRQSSRSATIQTLMKALEARDFITEGHADRLQSLVAALAQAAGLPETKTADMRLLTRFHDIGKVGIPDHILFKKGRLTPSEATVMQRHCEIGHRIALAAPDLMPIADWILYHHEWWDGNGYPSGLRGEEIPLECRILAICDAYDAMTSDRPYRQTISHGDALAEIKKFAGTQFDPALVTLFIEMLETPGLTESSA